MQTKKHWKMSFRAKRVEIMFQTMIIEIAL